MEPSTVGIVVASEPAEPRDRIVVLDVLRGMAILGMFMVHFWYRAGGWRPDGFMSSAIGLLVESKAFTTFAILFGAGFAIQLRQAQSRGERFTLRFLRRMLGLALFGFVAHGIFGYNVLLGYAMWGVALLVVWRWSTRALLITAVLCAMSISLYQIAAGAYQWATLGVEGTHRANARIGAADRAAHNALHQAELQSSFPVLVAARVRSMKWFYAQVFSWTPAMTFVKFLIGLLALRLGVWERPRGHRRLILAAMAFGLFSWVVSEWVLPLPWPKLPIGRVAGPIQGGFMLFRDEWLAFTYIGAVLLLVAYDRRWERRLDFFALAGRMALTNYMIQIILIDVLFRPYGLGIVIRRPELGQLAALALFGAQVAFSWWWLRHFRLGPAEWLLRSITYARFEPIRSAN